MFCTSCGAQIPGGAAFCTACGAPAVTGVDESAGLSQTGLPLEPQASRSRRPLSKKQQAAVIGAAAVATAAIVLLVALLAREPSDKTEDAKEQPAQAAEQSNKTTLLDLSDPDDYYDINIFLSNFAEWEEFYRNGKTFDRSNYDLEQLVNWGMWHNAINNEGTISTQSVELEGAPASEISTVIPVSPTTYPRHMETGLIEESITRYTGIEAELSGYVSGDGAYYERDGIMYEGYYRGSASPLDSVVLCTSAERDQRNTVRLEFTVYTGNQEYQKVADKSWYGLDAASLEEAMRQSGSTNVVTETGSAVVEVVDPEGDRTFKLVSFAVGEQGKRAQKGSGETQREKDEELAVQQVADQAAEYEETAVSFATQYFTNARFTEPGNDMEMELIGDGSWQGWAALVQAYLEPDSAAAVKFKSEMLDKEIPGWGAAGFVDKAEVLSSDYDVVTVAVDHAFTQNPYPGWFKERLARAVVTCHIDENGLVDSYDIDEG